MDPKHLPLVVAALQKKHPEVVNHLRALCASDPTVGTPVMHFLLETFDELEQVKWTMRDLLVQPRVPPSQTCLWALRHGPVVTVKRLAVHGYGQHVDPSEICPDWKESSNG